MLYNLGARLNGIRHNASVTRIGPCGWAYKDWEGIVYPAKKPKGFDRLAFLAQYFDAVEIDTSFYGPPRATSAKSWVESISGNPQFRFTAKLFRSFTHSRNATAKDERDFKDGMMPLVESGRFGALLLQFPWSFRYTPENRAYVAGLHRKFGEFPLVLEVRHATWAEPAVLDFLADLDIGVCNIDQPLFHKSIKPGHEVTSGIGYGPKASGSAAADGSTIRPVISFTATGRSIC
jgi:uncharacterized protein YecE (DUF72 family)